MVVTVEFKAPGSPPMANFELKILLPKNKKINLKKGTAVKPALPFAAYIYKARNNVHSLSDAMLIENTALNPEFKS